jgi:hypothetical protein
MNIRKSGRVPLGSKMSLTDLFVMFYEEESPMFLIRQVITG